MSQRETKTLTLPKSGKEVEIYAWMTPREMFRIIKSENASEETMKALIVRVDEEKSADKIVEILLDQIDVSDYKVLDDELTQLFPKQSGEKTT